MMFSIQKFFEAERDEVLHQLDEIAQILRQIHYESRHMWPLRFPRLLLSVKNLQDMYQRHVWCDETVIFPFVLASIPVLEPVIRLLRSERQLFENNWQSLKKDLPGLHDEKRKPQTHLNDDRLDIERLREKGLCSLTLMRSHIITEFDVVYGMMDERLSAVEKRLLHKRLRTHQDQEKKAFDASKTH